MKISTVANTYRLIALGLASLLGGCKSNPGPSANSVSFEIANRGNNDRAVTADGSTVFETIGYEIFTVSTLKYYLSNITLINTDGSRYAVPGFYHLVDASKPATTRFTLNNIPNGTYSGMTFRIGVDSAATKADPQTLTGDLSPSAGMYWSQSAGHICLKLEGTVISANNRPLVAHIGGYRHPYPATYLSALPFAGSGLEVRAGHTPLVSLGASILSIFSGRNNFHLSTFPNITAPGNLTTWQVAYNYSIGVQGGGMLYVDHIDSN